MLSIVVPAFNEEDNIPILVDGLDKYKDYFDELIIVDDNSNDKTSLVCKQLKKSYLKLLKNNKNGGIGYTLKKGTHNAKNDKVLWLMADLSDDISLIPQIDKQLDTCDIVLPSRYMKGGSVGNMTLRLNISIRLYKLALWVFKGITLKDSTQAFRGFRKGLFESLDIQRNDFSVSPEMTIKAHEKGASFCEIPCTYKERNAGSSNFRFIRMAKSYLSLVFK